MLYIDDVLNEYCSWQILSIEKLDCIEYVLLYQEQLREHLLVPYRYKVNLYVFEK